MKLAGGSMPSLTWQAMGGCTIVTLRGDPWPTVELHAAHLAVVKRCRVPVVGALFNVTL
jgi:hypothetical protein